MTKLELERRVAELEAKGGDDAPHRIQTLRDHYERQQAQQATEREKAQQRAEANLRADLKRAYLKSSPAATAEGFEADYPELRRQKLAQETLKADAVASAQQRAATREAF
jgi:hypothetical protein